MYKNRNKKFAINCNTFYHDTFIYGILFILDKISYFTAAKTTCA